MTPVTPGHPVLPDGSGIPCADGSASPGAVAAESRLLSRAFVKGKAFLALVALWLLCGCGGGLAFTGGSIPPGGTRLVGRVAEAEDPRKSVVNAVVQVETQPSSGGVRTLTATTAADGTFTFPSVPTGSTTSLLTVTVTPAPTTDPTQARQSQQVVFQAQNGVSGDLVVALPLNTFNVNQAASLKLGNIATVQKGETTVIHAHLYDSGGNRLPIEPTLLYTGNFGSIAPDDTFVSTEAGTGQVTAFWYSLPSATTPIVVALPNPSLPPAPPVQPDVPPFLDIVPNSPATH